MCHPCVYTFRDFHDNLVCQHSSIETLGGYAEYRSEPSTNGCQQQSQLIMNMNGKVMTSAHGAKDCTHVYSVRPPDSSHRSARRCSKRIANASPTPPVRTTYHHQSSYTSAKLPNMECIATRPEKGKQDRIVFAYLTRGSPEKKNEPRDCRNWKC